MTTRYDHVIVGGGADSPEPPRDILRADVRGMPVEQLAETISRRFLRYLDRAPGA